MGWWGHGVMDGDGPSDAAYMIKVRALGGKDEELGREIAEEYEDMVFAEEVTTEDKQLLRAFVHDNVAMICNGAMKDARANWSYGGPAELIAAAHELVNTYGVKALPRAMKERLKVAFEIEIGEEADDFDSPRARRNELKSVRTRIMRVRTL